MMKISEIVKVLDVELSLYEMDGINYFSASEVGEIIEYSKANISKMVSKVDECERIKICVHTDSISTSPKARKTQYQWFLTKDGLHELLFQSVKPIAKEFKRQVKIILKNVEENGYYISDGKSDKWICTRREVKEARNDLTSALKLLREYAINQGSVNYRDRESAIYTNYTNMLNVRMGIKSKERDLLTQQQLMDMRMYENMQKKIIIKGIENNIHYKQIYKDVKEFINMI